MGESVSLCVRLDSCIEAKIGEIHAMQRETLALQRREKRVDDAILRELDEIADAVKGTGDAALVARLHGIAKRLGSIAPATP